MCGTMYRRGTIEVYSQRFFVPLDEAINAVVACISTARKQLWGKKIKSGDELLFKLSVPDHFLENPKDNERTLIAAINERVSGITAQFGGYTACVCRENIFIEVLWS